MPQQRRRIVFCDCLDCVQQPSTTDISSSNSLVNEAAAKQEPPPRCLMFILSGVLLPSDQNKGPAGTDTLLDACNLPHINRATLQGNLCLLTTRLQSTPDPTSELAQLFGVFQDLEQHKQPISIADRFKGMQVSFSTNSRAAAELAEACGMSSSTILHSDTAFEADAAAVDSDNALSAAPDSLLPELSGVNTKQRCGSVNAAAAAAAVGRQLPDPAEAARRILQELSLQQPEAGLDMLVVHVDSPSLAKAQHQEQEVAAATAVAVVSWLDRTLRYLNNSSAFKDAVLLAVLATPGAAGKLPAAVPMLADHAEGTVIHFQLQQPEVVTSLSKQEATEEHITASSPSCTVQSGWTIAANRQQVARPMQSWQQLGGVAIDIDPQRPVLCMRRLPGVVRRDACTRFTLNDCCSNTGVLGLVVDRLIPEIAYKLGRAPKYGA